METWIITCNPVDKYPVAVNIMYHWSEMVKLRKIFSASFRLTDMENAK